MGKAFHYHKHDTPYNITSNPQTPLKWGSCAYPPTRKGAI